MITTPLCSSCRRSEIREPAAFAITGRLDGRPYRANLCEDHLADLRASGLDLHRCRRIQPAPKAATVGAHARSYRHLLATVSLDATGLAKLNAARDAMTIALIDGRAA